MPFSSAAGVGLAARLHGRAAVHLERAQRGHEDERARPDARLPALDVEELLAAEIEAEARLGDRVVAEAHRRGASRARSCSRARCCRTGPQWTMRRAALLGLHEVRLERVAQDARSSRSAAPMSPAVTACPS